MKSHRNERIQVHDKKLNKESFPGIPVGRQYLNIVLIM